MKSSHNIGNNQVIKQFNFDITLHDIILSSDTELLCSYPSLTFEAHISVQSYSVFGIHISSVGSVFHFGPRGQAPFTKAGGVYFGNNTLNTNTT